MIQYPLKRGEDIYEIPDSIVVIEKFAFHNNKELQYIKFNNGLTTINDMAFAEMTGLKTLILPQSIASIGNGIFKGCSNLRIVMLREKDGMTCGNNSFE